VRAGGTTRFLSSAERGRPCSSGTRAPQRARSGARGEPEQPASGKAQAADSRSGRAASRSPPLRQGRGNPVGPGRAGCGQDEQRAIVAAAIFLRRKAKSPSPLLGPEISSDAELQSYFEIWVFLSTRLGSYPRLRTSGSQSLYLTEERAENSSARNGFRPRAYKKRVARCGCLSSRALSPFSDHVWWFRGL
jgi:hypothetical protein